VRIAHEIGGEIISADSRQVYTGMDVGTGKVTKKEMGGVPHHLLDVASPKRAFSVARFKKLADKAAADILRRGKTPIICGGTGLYIDAVAYGVVLPEVPSDTALRKTLSTKNVSELFAQLEALDPERAVQIDAKNPVRLIRAIEIATALGSVPKTHKTLPFDVLTIGLDMDDETLKARIHTRLLERMKRGMLGEVESLHSTGLSYKRLYMLGLEYRFLGLFMEGKNSKPQMLAELEMAIWHYAKRQRTWFKKNKDTMWINPLKEADAQKAIDLCKDFLKS
jgi:tRNA dimethylallyltransferase